MRCGLMFRTASLALVLAGVAQSAGARPQDQAEVVTVPDAIACVKCRIELEKIATIGDPSDPVALTERTKISRGPDGRYYAAPVFARGTIAVFDEQGRFVSRLGRQGEGPGEFSRILDLLFDANGALHVFETGRHTIFDVGSTQVRSVVALGGSVAFPRADQNGAVVVQRLSPSSLGSTTDLVGVLDANGTQIASFLGGPESSDPWDRLRLIGHGIPGHVWVAPVNRYRLELWSIRGEQIRVIEREAGFFTPWTGYNRMEPTLSKPRPRLRSLYQSDADTLWAVISLPAEDWKADVSTTGEARNVGVSQSKYWDLVMEVIDLREGFVVTRLKLDAFVSPMRGSEGFVTLPRESGDAVVMDVFQPRLRR